MNTIEKVAQSVLAHMITDTRYDGKPFRTFDNTAEEWMRDMIIQSADSYNLDTLYTYGEQVLIAIAGNYPDDIEPDTHISSLTAWLAADTSHVEYLTNAMDNGASDGGNAFDLLQAAQMIFLDEMRNNMINMLEDQIVEEEDPAEEREI